MQGFTGLETYTWAVCRFIMWIPKQRPAGMKHEHTCRYEKWRPNLHVQAYNRRFFSDYHGDSTLTNHRSLITYLIGSAEMWRCRGKETLTGINWGTFEASVKIRTVPQGGGTVGNADRIAFIRPVSLDLQRFEHRKQTHTSHLLTRYILHRLHCREDSENLQQVHEN